MEGKHIFDAEELARCADKGECVQCGLCCVAYPIPGMPLTVPESVSDAAVKLEYKGGMMPCWHLQETSEGRFQCAAHEAKGHPELRACRDWQGNRGGYEHVKTLYWVQLLLGFHDDDESREILLLGEKFAARGVLQERLAKETFANVQIARFVFRCLNLLSAIPRELFKTMGISEWVAGLDYEEFCTLFCDPENEYSLDRSNGVHSAFIADYAPFILPG